MRIAFAFLVLALLSSPAAAADEHSREMVWDGYVYKDRDGRTRLGWPVVAMGVMAQPAHVVGGEMGKKLAPLHTKARDDYVFWNYDLERGGEARGRLPRVLVQLRGKVTFERDPDEMTGSMSGGTRTMEEARLVSVEFVPDNWLNHWAVFFTDKRSPFRIDVDRPRPGEKELRAFAPVALAALLKMRKVPGPGDAERKRAAAIDAKAKVVARFRSQTEWGIRIWIEHVNEKFELGLDLGDLGPRAPTAVEMQRWFLEAASKAEFLATVKKAFPGELELLTLVHYVKSGRSVSYATADLATVRDAWSEEAFKGHQAATKEILDR